MLRISLLLLLLLLQPLLLAKDALGLGLVWVSTEQGRGEAIHKDWDNLLKIYVDEQGNVDYKGFKKELETLDRYLEQLGDYSIDENWSREKKLAYFINLYNAGTVKLILDNYPVESIKEIKRPWDKTLIRQGGELISLGKIEHKILRKMNEPRIHFAINCASYSCPKLLNQAYTEDKLEEQLNFVTKDFINDTSRNIFSETKIELSKIFKWYQKDFEYEGSLIAYLNQYSKSYINPKVKIEYLNYNWSLNETRK